MANKNISDNENWQLWDTMQEEIVVYTIDDKTNQLVIKWNLQHHWIPY